MEGPLPVTQADAVVIGAGAFGLSTAYQLAAHGAGEVVFWTGLLPDRRPRARRSLQADPGRRDAHPPGAIEHRGDPWLQLTTGIPLPYVQSGSVLAARTAEHAALVDEEAQASAGWGVELEKSTRRGVRRIAPYLTGRDIRSAYFVPGDIYIEEPRSLLDAYMAAISNSGRS